MSLVDLPFRKGDLCRVITVLTSYSETIFRVAAVFDRACYLLPMSSPKQSGFIHVKHKYISKLGPLESFVLEVETDESD